MREKAEDILKQDSYLKSNIANMVLFASKKSGFKFSSFLDERQQKLAQDILRHEKWEHFHFYGGAENCERKMLGVFSPEYEEYQDFFPIQAIAVEYSEKSSSQLSHRDFLGALMNIQIKRETIGDIWTDNNAATIFAKSDMAEFLLQNLNRVGNATVSLSFTESDRLVKKQEVKQISGTVPSLRLDCVVAMLSNKSRTNAVQLINMGYVKVEHLECTSVSKQLGGTEAIAIRGMGKFVLTGEQKKTKKDRIFITANHLL